MANSVAVKCLVMGEASPGPALEPVRLELAVERISVRELIGRTVAEQIRELTEQRRAEAEVVQLALARQYLTARDVEAQAEAGRIRFPAEPKPRRGGVPAIDIGGEVAKALGGFEAGAFRVVADGVTLESLDEEIAPGPDTKVVFLRLMPLVGG
jgi:hypothetical protein